jgi:putative peptidoglycan lipid II flippase
MAAAFGSSIEIAGFMVAYRLANLFRRLLGEGNLQAGFVPYFVKIGERGPQFFRDLVYSMGLILILTILLIEGALWGCSQVVGGEWTPIIDLTMWMSPGLFFICLFGLNSALLQCRKKYFLAGVAPVAFNLIWITSVLIYPNIAFLSLAIVAAFAGQWLITAREGFSLLPFKEWLKPRLFSPDFRALVKPMLYGIIGVGAVQFNSALDAIFARLADLEGPAFLWYAIRIQQLPLALFVVALSGALLPPLARTEDPLQRMKLLQSALRHSAALMLFCTFGIFALGIVGVNLLYGHGGFTPQAVKETTDCLWGYGVGLIPAVFVLLLANRYYAEKNYWAPMIASLYSVGLNIALNALFVLGFKWGAFSIAIATSLSSFLNMFLLSRGVFTFSFARFFTKMALACLLPAIGSLSLMQWMEPFTREIPVQIFQFFSLGAIYCAGVMILAWKLGLAELADFVRRKDMML